MPLLPNNLALTNIADGALVLASDHRNNYAAIQNAVNSLIGWGAGTTLADVYANRPAANTVSPGVLFYATDTWGTWRSDGTTWTLVQQGTPLITSAQMSAPPFTTPYDRQRISLDVSSADGLQWEFQYRAASPSAYKWELVGGGIAYALLATSETSSSTSWTDLATVGPYIAAPRSGDYTVTASCWVANSVARGITSMGVAVDAGVGDELIMQCANGNDLYQLTGITRVQGINVGQQMRMRYKVGANVGTWMQRKLNVLPIRVS